jgi:hypothetical protein
MELGSLSACQLDSLSGNSLDIGAIDAEAVPFQRLLAS